MKIISLNIWGGKLKDPLLNFLRDHSDETDIFCLQEVFRGGESTRPVTESWNMQIFNEIKSVLPNHTGHFHPSEKDEEGLALFIKKDILVKEVGDVFVYRWKDAMENDDARTLGRNLQYVSFTVNESRCLVANFHGLWNGAGKLDSEDRLSQSWEIVKFIDSRNEGVKILMGDFNLAPDTQSVGFIETRMRNLIKEYGVATTRTSLYKHRGVEKFADYAFVSSGVKVSGFKILGDEVSDHSPLTLEIEL